MRRLSRRRAAGGTADHGGAAPALRPAAACAAFLILAVGMSTGTHVVSPGSGSARTAGVTRDATTFQRIVLPDLLVVAPAGLSHRQITRLGRLGHVRNMIVFDGAEITAGGQPASVIGVNPDQFRSWVPLRTASNQAVWSALASGGFVAAPAARRSLRLRPGQLYPLAAAATVPVKFAYTATLGVAGVDLVVNRATSRELGLVRQVAALISAPGASLQALRASARTILGPRAKIVSLRPRQLPVVSVTSDQQPTTYLELFKAAAARYCPGLSWTVLAAIGQIESGDGANVGPSTAGALGPMQFLPSTWKVWGIDGFGQTGPPDIMNPYDAVPSAARLLCADGAAAGGSALSRAIFDYNHATWYVRQVLALAAQYAADYP